jgi:amidophosphoribosyltransferase
MLIDDSIVRGTQTRETTEFLYNSGAKEVHIRTACPPTLFGCKYLNFSRNTSEMDLIARRVIARLEGENAEQKTLQPLHTVVARTCASSSRSPSISAG